MDSKTRDKCTGCMYRDFQTWMNADFDPCFLCNKQGSMHTVAKEDKDAE